MLKENPIKKKLKVKAESLPSNKSRKKLILKTILVASLVLLSAAALVYAGFWYGRNQTVSQQEVQRQTQKTPLSGGQVQEVPYGDEFAETDVEYQRQMQAVTDEGPSGEESPWLTYRNETYGFSFQYPVTVFLEKTNGQSLPLVYLDTKLIIIPKAYDSMLTPVEVRVAPLIENASVNERKAGMKDLFYPGTYQETRLNPPLKGIKVSGTWQGYPFEGEEFQEVILDGPKGLIVITYMPSDNFPKSLFNKILNTFRFL